MNAMILSIARPIKHKLAQKSRGARVFRQPRSRRIAHRMLVTPHKAYTASAIVLVLPQYEGVGECSGRTRAHALNGVLAHELDDRNRLLGVELRESADRTVQLRACRRVKVPRLELPRTPGSGRSAALDERSCLERAKGALDERRADVSGGAQLVRRLAGAAQAFESEQRLELLIGFDALAEQRPDVVG